MEVKKKEKSQIDTTVEINYLKGACGQRRMDGASNGIVNGK